jgi:hypothetical protein
MWVTLGFENLIVRDGLRMQRYCPHAGEDLTYARIAGGRVECLEKGDIALRVGHRP